MTGNQKAEVLKKKDGNIQQNICDIVKKQGTHPVHMATCGSQAREPLFANWSKGRQSLSLRHNVRHFQVSLEQHVRQHRSKTNTTSHQFRHHCRHKVFDDASSLFCGIAGMECPPITLFVQGRCFGDRSAHTRRRRSDVDMVIGLRLVRVGCLFWAMLFLFWALQIPSNATHHDFRGVRNFLTFFDIEHRLNQTHVSNTSLEESLVIT